MAACSAGLLLGGARGRWGWTPPVGVNKAFVQRRVTPTRCGPACAQSTATDEDVIPARAKKTTAHVKAGDVDVYIIGISHVSRVGMRLRSPIEPSRGCDAQHRLRSTWVPLPQPARAFLQESVVQVRELIAAVKPDALVLELCKERVDLLVSEQAIDQSDPALMVSHSGLLLTRYARPRHCCPRPVGLACPSGMRTGHALWACPPRPGGRGRRTCCHTWPQQQGRPCCRPPTSTTTSTRSYPRACSAPSRRGLPWHPPGPPLPSWRQQAPRCVCVGHQRFP